MRDLPASVRACLFELDTGLAQTARRAGGVFGCVVGVDRAGQAGVLREPGAVVVVADLSELLVAP